MKKILIVIPAYNERDILEKNIIKLHNFLEKNIREYSWKILISNNASMDDTGKIAEKLSLKYGNLKVIHMKEKPKSLSIKNSWLSEKADIYVYMDADLSTDIKHIPELIQGIEEGYDIVIGSRTSEKSETSRNFNRHLISITLITMLKVIFSIKVSDFQCGFKAINKKVRDNIIPKMRALKVGFMDTEMLIIANKKKYKIKEIPVIWKDTRKSHAPIFKGIFDALINMIRIKINLMVGRYN